MEEGKILTHQQSAGVLKMWLCSLLAMLPFTSSGCIWSYLSMGLPQLLEPNGYGFLLDIHQLSWICRCYILNKFIHLYYIYIIMIFSGYHVLCSNPRTFSPWIFIRKVWKKEDVGRGQYSPDHHLLLVLLLQLIPHVESHQCADNNDLLHCHDTRLLLAIRGKIYK